MDYSKCAICGREHSLFQLKIEAEDTDADEDFLWPVCGKCWEIIAAIAKLVVKQMLTQKEGQP